MKHTGIGLIFLVALGVSVVFGQIPEHPLGGLVEGYKDAIRLRIEMEKARALENESNARAEAIRAETERLRQQQKAMEANPLPEPPDLRQIKRPATDGSLERAWGLSNGRAWRTFDEGMKAGYVIGFDNAVALFQEKGEHLRSGATHGETLDGIERFYQKPENAALPILFAIRSFAMKVKGSTDAEIEGSLIPARKMVNDFFEGEAKKTAPPK